MRTFLISDTHFFHTNIIKYCLRPYENADDMNAKMKELWNNAVGPDDLLIHVGDVTAGLGGRRAEFATLLDELHGKKILVRGNHDHEKDKFYLDHGFLEVVESLHAGNLMFAHFPARVEKEYPHPMHEVSIQLRFTMKPQLFVHGHEHHTGTPEHEGHFNCASDRHNFTPFSLESMLERCSLQPLFESTQASLENRVKLLLERRLVKKS